MIFFVYAFDNLHSNVIEASYGPKELGEATKDLKILMSFILHGFHCAKWIYENRQKSIIFPDLKIYGKV